MHDVCFTYRRDDWTILASLHQLAYPRVLDLQCVGIAVECQKSPHADLIWRSWNDFWTVEAKSVMSQAWFRTFEGRQDRIRTLSS